MCCNGFININISTDVFRIFALNMILMLAIMITTVARKSNKLCYDITGEYNLDLISSISKYATCILNDGEGGYIKWICRKLSRGQTILDINVALSAMRSEITKIKPVVHETKYQFTQLQQTGVLIEIAPVPWGLEAYAAPDGHVYIAGVAEDSINGTSEQTSNGNREPLHTNSEIKHENNIETQDDIAMETSDYYECLSMGVVPKAEEKETGMLPCEIKSIIDDCVQDLRDIKSTLGIHSTLERPALEEINTLPQQKSSTRKKLYHCKSQSDQLYAVSQQSMRHWKSDPVVSDISGSNGFKTLCEEIPFSPCRDGKPLPSTSSKLLQVDGEGRGDVGDGLDTSDYVVPQLDGVYDQNIVKEESNSGSEAYKLQEFYDLQKHKSSIVIFWLGLVLVALVQYGSGPIVFPIPNSVERVSYAEQSPSLNRTITYNVNQQQRIGLANSGTGKSWVPFASVDFVYLNTNFYDQERIESEEILHNANKVNKNDKERDETEERVYKRIDSNNRMGIYDGFAYTIVKVPLLGLIQFGRGQTVLLIAKSESAIPTSMSITTILEIPYHSDMSLENVQSFVAENLNCSTMPICETTMRTNQHDVPDLSCTQDVISAAHMTKLIFPNGLFNRDIAINEVLQQDDISMINTDIKI